LKFSILNQASITKFSKIKKIPTQCAGEQFNDLLRSCGGSVKSLDVLDATSFCFLLNAFPEIQHGFLGPLLDREQGDIGEIRLAVVCIPAGSTFLVTALENDDFHGSFPFLKGEFGLPGPSDTRSESDFVLIY